MTDKTAEDMARRMGELLMENDRLRRALLAVIERDTYANHHNATGTFARIARRALGVCDD